MTNETLETHFKFMRMALDQAEAAHRAREVPVGCLFVYNNTEVVSTGSNLTNDTLSGIRHAELVGIDEILERFNLTSSENKYDAERQHKIYELFSKIDLYVTIEPCVMCGSALRQIGINRVFFGAANDRFGGNGSIFTINHDDLGIEHVSGNNSCFDKTYESYPDFGREEAIILLRKFYVGQNKKAPNPQTKEEDSRLLRFDQFPLMKYSKYITKKEFLKMYGESNVHRWIRSESGEDLTEAEGMFIENWIDPLMPLKKEVKLEMDEWQRKIQEGVINENRDHDRGNDVKRIKISGD
ncbi:tRNA(adenine34) deaminase [Saccharomycopsis crataegensis]|uniref:tRNA(Adenine34) deaminase n=1 Tax=Saccharomycopsis crataegensis TaxID=43959 RepID=A0AAV5QJ07_9ASCO|nr:tRNA(adenine34) deaminase [Saccharomycopsis crataegensis]